MPGLEIRSVNYQAMVSTAWGPIEKTPPGERLRQPLGYQSLNKNFTPSKHRASVFHTCRPIALVGVPWLSLSSSCLQGGVHLGCLTHPSYCVVTGEKKSQGPFTAFSSLWTRDTGWFGQLRGSRLLEEVFSPPGGVKLYEALIVLLFSFPEVNFRPVESARGSWAGQESEGLYVPMRKVREEEQPGSQRSILSSPVYGVEEKAVREAGCFSSWLQPRNLQAWPTSLLLLSFPACWVGSITQVFVLRDT